MIVLSGAFVLEKLISTKYLYDEKLHRLMLYQNIRGVPRSEKLGGRGGGAGRQKWGVGEK